jgi:hypothetical protein
MANSQPTARDAMAPADDLLDQVVEAVLIEATRETAPEPTTAAGAPESDAEVFLRRATAFLNARADRAELIEKLRASVGDHSGEPKPERSHTQAASDKKPE